VQTDAEGEGRKLSHIYVGCGGWLTFV
jgi:hypothetical protein